MKRVIIFVASMLTLNLTSAQKKITNLFLTPFTENTIKKNGLRIENYDSYETFYTKNNFKEGDGKMISLVLFGKNRFEDAEDNNIAAKWDWLVFHKFYLFCFINDQKIQAESLWYEKDPENKINFENDKYIIRMKYDDAPYIYEKWQVLIIDKNNFKSEIFNLYRYNRAWGE